MVKSTTVRLSTEDESLREALASHLGITKAGVIRMAMRKLARAEGIAIPEPPPKPQKNHTKKKRAGGR